MNKSVIIRKSVAIVLLVILMFGVFPFLSDVIATGAYDFANFTEADSMAFVEACGIAIPEEFVNKEGFSEFTRDLVMRAYEDPYAPFFFNYGKT